MLLSLSWLREFVPYEGEVQALADKLTMLGLEVDAVERPFAALEKIVVGHVVECGRHPDADKLSVTRVDVGSEVLDIVCGAPNVARGQKVAVATVGTTLPDGLTIKKAKLRGQPSNGMICSERELGLGEGHSGILVLDPMTPVGLSLTEALSLESHVLDIDLTPNRADCLSIMGLARETAMAFNLPFSVPGVTLTEDASERASDLVRIEIADPEQCPLYQGRVVRGMKIGPSPDWMRYRLIAMGQRPISNVVDVTNYVMLETGQPLHAFDMDLIEGGTIRVALAEAGTAFVTLDGQERSLLSTDLLIHDGAKPVALAGVMGGANSEIGDGSTNLLLESAVFRPGTIRKTARRLALHSEASHRFERGVDQPGSRHALDRAAALIAELSGGRIVSGVTSSEPEPWQQPVLRFRPKRAGAVVGIDFDPAFCERTLRGVGCELEKTDTAEWTVRAPSFRRDLEREIDLVEEVARVYGIDRIPETMPAVIGGAGAPVGGGEFDFLMRLKHWGRGAGLRECIYYSFVAEADLDALRLPREGRVRVANPLTEDQAVMRTSVVAGLLQALRANLNQGNADLRLFEVAKTYFADETSDTRTREHTRLGILLHGGRFPGGHPWPADALADYADLKGLVEDLARALGVSGLAFTMAGEHPFLSPCVSVSANGRDLGLLGLLDPEIAGEYRARSEVWLADLDVAALRDAWSAEKISFCELPRFPASWRDVTLVTPHSVHVDQVLAAMRGAGVKLLEDARLVDSYAPKGGDGRNLTFRLTYRAPDRTLRDADVDKAHGTLTDKVLAALSVRLQ
ncbi:Phenylalanyl-tRNA synthetase beta chain [Desulfovibrio sp. X2]|uniref:phenylalanine--tRNA ligase subunit beta n=1 Tax=Desulfovibrio sp. X2 TaxID=941449 RepID=UPI00035891A4|nr:phenylalanine--tRNA ligase subunit beta [Desulfovibrio sp. X2]EPR40786.1 Phenylalanyl-tRNA synthetase beta chain [Desulfovibrio sp. X2]